MYKPSTYLVVIYLFSYLSTYIGDLFPTELVTKVKPNINSVEVHPQLSNNGHPVDGCWFILACILLGPLWFSQFQNVFLKPVLHLDYHSSDLFKKL
jgi:hypothetical protein